MLPPALNLKGMDATLSSAAILTVDVLKAGTAAHNFCAISIRYKILASGGAWPVHPAVSAIPSTLSLSYEKSERATKL